MKKKTNLSIEDILNVKHDVLMIIGEKKSAIDKSLTSLSWATQKETPTNSIVISKKISSDEKEELLELLKIDKISFYNRIIDIVLQNHMLVLENYCRSYYFSPRKKTYNEYISFNTGNYRICFVEEAVKIFDSKIKELKLQRIHDSKTYASNLIENGNVKNLYLSLSTTMNGCDYDGFGFLDDELSQILDYYISQNNNREGSKDFKNMLDIIDKFILKYGIIKNIVYRDNQLLASNYSNNHFIEIDDFDKMPELVKKIVSLQERG